MIKSTNIKTKENKELLLIDLCARLPYGIKFPYHMEKDCNHKECNCIAVIESISKDRVEFTYEDNGYPIDWSCSLFQVKPYLRTMDSMTKEEEEEFVSFTDTMFRYGKDNNLCCLPLDAIQWLLRNYFDFMGLIPKGLAIAVTKENNPYKQ